MPFFVLPPPTSHKFLGIDGRWEVGGGSLTSDIGVKWEVRLNDSERWEVLKQII